MPLGHSHQDLGWMLESLRVSWLICSERSRRIEMDFFCHMHPSSITHVKLVPSMSWIICISYMLKKVRIFILIAQGYNIQDV
jgi:hypothetical protein